MVHAYPCFLDQLVRVPFSQDAPDMHTERLLKEIVGVLADALQDVHCEVYVRGRRARASVGTSGDGASAR